MLTSKQRAFLRSIITKQKAIIQIGKEGLTDNLIKQIEEALEANELVKITVLNNAPCDTKEISKEIAQKVNGEIIQVIGKKFSVYRMSKECKINLP